MRYNNNIMRPDASFVTCGNSRHCLSIELPRTWQTTIGFQRQFGTTMAVEVDYVYQGRFEKDVLDNMNLLFDPATGANLNFNVGATAPTRTGASSR